MAGGCWAVGGGRRRQRAPSTAVPAACWGHAPAQPSAQGALPRPTPSPTQRAHSSQTTCARCARPCLQQGGGGVEGGRLAAHQPGEPAALLFQEPRGCPATHRSAAGPHTASCWAPRRCRDRRLQQGHARLRSAAGGRTAATGRPGGRVPQGRARRCHPPATGALHSGRPQGAPQAARRARAGPGVGPRGPSLASRGADSDVSIGTVAHGASAGRLAAGYDCCGRSEQRARRAALGAVPDVEGTRPGWVCVPRGPNTA